MKGKVGEQWHKIFMEIFRSMSHGFLLLSPLSLDGTWICAGGYRRFRANGLRRNPSGSWVILIFSGQNPCTRIIKTILHFFLHFSRVTDIQLKLLVTSVTTPKDNFLRAPQKINFKFHWNCEKTGKLSFVTFNSVKFEIYFSGSLNGFSLALLQITDYICSLWKCKKECCSML